MDQQGSLWIGTVSGLDRFDPETETFTHYLNSPNQSNLQGGNIVASVYSIYEDPQGQFWIGTGKGLGKIDWKHQQYTDYPLENNILNILEEDIPGDGKVRHLWLSAAKGLIRFNPETETFRTYDVTDGLQSNTFSFRNTSYKSHTGELLFGGIEGLTAFYPEQISDNYDVPPVVITDFQLAGKPVTIGQDSVLQQSIIRTKQINLSYRDRVFSFQFAALNYRAPQRNQYKYKLVGFEDEWTEVDSSRNFVTYTNLNPGKYVFRVIASNNDGVWNEQGTSLAIIMTPPWWETLWFKAIVGYQGKRHKILVVDDKLENRMVLLDLLDPLGFEIILGKNGREGLEYAEMIHPDLILVDLVMPVMTGFEMIERIRQKPEMQNMPIVAVSSSTFFQDKQRNLNISCQGFLSKAIVAQELFATIEKHLKIEWIYDSVDSPVEISEPEIIAAETMIIPPQEDLEALYELTMFGDLGQLQAKVNEIAQISPQYRAFTQVIREYAEKLEDEPILDLLTKYINSNHNSR
jgi:CheY-like chemotaxis protein